MTELYKPIKKEHFINNLKNNFNLWKYFEKWKYSIRPPISNIEIKQQGAGSGKTYGIIQLINDYLAKTTSFSNRYDYFFNLMRPQY